MGFSESLIIIPIVPPQLCLRLSHVAHLVGFLDFLLPVHSAFPSELAKRAAFSLPEQTFDFLEKPEYYFDGYHLNAKGRQKFTRKLVAEVVGQLRSDDSHASQ